MGSRVTLLGWPEGVAVEPHGFHGTDRDRFLDRDLSWISLSQRVLEEAENCHHPLLSRVRFLSISAANLDEFLMFRVSDIYRRVESQPGTASLDGLPLGDHLDRVGNAIARLVAEQQRCWRLLSRELDQAGIAVLEAEDVTPSEVGWLEDYLLGHVFPLLTPFAVDPAHPFPFIPTQGLVVALQLHRKRDGQLVKALLPLPIGIARFVRLPGPAIRFVALETLMRLFPEILFPGYDVIERGLFRILRESNVRADGEGPNLVQLYETAVKRRRQGPITRIIVEAGMSENLRRLVVADLGIEKDRLVAADGFLGLSDIAQLIVEDRPDLRFPAYTPRFPERIRDFGGDCFDAIRFKDMIVHHPYESFDVVVQFLRQAAADPAVVAIKQTLYRTTEESPVIRALIEAAEVGKTVTALVELKAEFDEAMNIRWARELQRAGVQVVYGSLNFITHAKVSLVVRREDGGLRTYVHFGTGNYHPVNAQGYTDLSLFTADPDFGRDASALFSLITGYMEPQKLRRLVISPYGLRDVIRRMIDGEISHAQAGRPAAIWAKMNALGDPAIIDALYRASQAGVQIDLVVRGTCCLRPGVPGLSENIRVKSIVGRFLEHARIACFGDGHGLPSPKAKVFISSADWMSENFDGRIETLVPILNPTVHQQVLNEVMAANLKDEAQSWTLDSQGAYTRVTAEAGAFSAQQYFMTNPSRSGRGSSLRIASSR